MYKSKDKDVLGQEDRIPSPRRSGVTVPGPATSSSYDGLSDACTAGASENNASAKTDVGGLPTSVFWAERESASRSGSASRELDIKCSVVLDRVLMPPPRQSCGAVTGGVMDLVDDEDAEMPLVSRSSSSSTIHGTDTTNAASAADEATPQKKKDGRGRPPSTGEYIGVGRARMEVKRKREAAEEVWRRRLLASDEQHFDEEEEGRAAAGSKRAKRHTRRDFLKDGPERREPIGDLTTAQVVERITEALEAVGNVAAKSGNLKGGYVKALKDSVATIKEAAEEVKERAERDDEMVRISRQLARTRGENKRLSAELQELRIELAGLTANCGAPSSRGKPPLQAQESGDPAGMVTREELTRTIGEAINSLSSKLAEEIRRGVGAEVASRFDILMPVSRPPLATDNRRPPATSRPPQATGESKPGRGSGKNRSCLPAALSQKAKKGGEPPARQPATQKRGIPDAPVARPLASSSSPTETWTQVVGRKERKEKQGGGARKAPPARPPPPSQASQRQLQQQQQKQQGKGGGKKN